MARDRIFVTTLSASVVIHLSMITLFSIYVLIPVKRPQYYEFDIVDPVTHESVIRRPLEDLRMPSFDDVLRNGTGSAESVLPGPDLSLNAPPELATLLPDIALPSLDMAQLERSEMIVSSLRIRSEFEADRGQDAWGRFLSGIGKLDDRLREFSPFESIVPGEAEKNEREPIARPAEGLAMYVEWVGEPNDRELMFSAPIASLWRIDPRTMREPIAVPFKVNAEGKVVLVLAPPSDEGEVTAEVGAALENFQFAPLTTEVLRDQYGTLVIAPERGR
ncbi:MAG: hypothetical protein SGI88_04705 [Candidatus Hydrogenedentes bacterium]|nr:hypothetical protein [Candidatus Hydrogenedentota bacterium]